MGKWSEAPAWMRWVIVGLVVVLAVSVWRGQQLANEVEGYESRIVGDYRTLLAGEMDRAQAGMRVMDRGEGEDAGPVADLMVNDIPNGWRNRMMFDQIYYLPFWSYQQNIADYVMSESLDDDGRELAARNRDLLGAYKDDVEAALSELEELHSDAEEAHEIVFHDLGDRLEEYMAELQAMLEEDEELFRSILGDAFIGDVD